MSQMAMTFGGLLLLSIFASEFYRAPAVKTTFCAHPILFRSLRSLFPFRFRRRRREDGKHAPVMNFVCIR